MRKQNQNIEKINMQWDTLYNEKGIVQEEPSEFVKEIVGFFKQQNIGKILDFGCGTGRHTVVLLNHGFKVYGCDYSESALKIVKEVIPKVEFKHCDMTSLPYENDSFDGILCYQVIQHGKIADIKKAIAEMYRIVRKSGIVALTVISTKHPTYLTGEEIEQNTKINTDAMDGHVPHHFFSEKELKELFNDFEIIKLEHIEGRSELDANKKSGAFILYARKPSP